MRLTEDEAYRIIGVLLEDLEMDRVTLISIYETYGFLTKADSQHGDAVIALTQIALLKLQLLKDLIAKDDAPKVNESGEALIRAWVKLAAAIKGACPDDN